MDQQDLCIEAQTAPARNGHGHARPEIHGASVLRINGWLTEGLSAARARPLIWLAAILGSADLATALELVAPYRLFATLLLSVLAGAAILTPADSDRAYQRSAAETRWSIRRHCEALLVVVLAGAAIIGVGRLFSFALLHAIVYAVVIAAVWFAPALIVLRKCSPLEAMAISLRAVFHNAPVALVYAIVLAADAWLAQVVPMMIRALVLTPLISALFLLSMHGSYRDILSINPAEDD